MDYKEIFRRLNAKCVIVYGTEENAYEMGICTSDNVKEAHKEARKYRNSLGEWEHYAEVCENAEELADGVETLAEMRIEMLANCFEENPKEAVAKEKEKLFA